MEQRTRTRKLKKRITQACALFLILVGVLTAILFVSLRGGLPATTLWEGLGFGALGVVMLLLSRSIRTEAGASPLPSSAANDLFARRAASKKAAPSAQRSPTPMPPPLKPYPRDPKKPAGSKENPIIVGMPEYSTTLIHDEANGRWILTDGLGNGWIR